LSMIELRNGSNTASNRFSSIARTPRACRKANSVSRVAERVDDRGRELPLGIVLLFREPDQRRAPESGWNSGESRTKGTR
jgi:hypothetical protein